jgi:hypothetical protein
MPVQRELRQGSSARIAATEVASRDLLLPLEPNRHFMPRKIDVPIDAPAFGKAELLVVTPAPQGDGANAEALAEPRRHDEFGRGVGIVAAPPPTSGVIEIDALNVVVDKTLCQAARDMGATPFQIFREIIFPLSLLGIAIGMISV